eukprot:UN00643
MSVVFITVGLWCAFKPLEDFWGSLGTIGLIPVFLFYSFGILTKEELKSIDWSIILLLGGGEVLGRAVKDSKLLKLASEQIEDALEDESTWADR